MLLTLKGTPFIYYGEEIGMTNGKLRKHEIADPLGKQFWPFFKGRDRARTPMQWTSAINAGFSTHTPWLPVNNDYLEVNVRVESGDSNSVLYIYKKLIYLRNKEKILQSGDWIPITRGEKGILSYYRVLGGEKMLVLLNFRNRSIDLPTEIPVNSCVLISTHRWSGSRIIHREDKLYPYEATVIRIDK
jgi:alpha-glucosidase